MIYNIIIISSFLPNSVFASPENCLSKSGFYLSCPPFNFTRNNVKFSENYNLGEISKDSPEDCKEFCAQDEFCTMYQFDLQNKTCKTCKTGILDKISDADDSNKTSGWCPNVKQDFITGNLPETKYWCGKFNQKLCNFPFKLEGKLLYEPFNDEGVLKCITEDDTRHILQTFDDNKQLIKKEMQEINFTRSDLKECVDEPCHGNLVLEGVRYSAFPLDRREGKNDYRFVTVAECQYLCHITDQCLYFNWQPRNSYIPSEGLGICWLKYGMGKKDTPIGTNANLNRFGHRNTAAACVTRDWSQWSGCSENCGEGNRTRSNIFLQQRNGGTCDGETQTEPCNLPTCQEDRSFQSQSSSDHIGLLIGLSMFVLLGLIVLCWLYLRIRRNKAKAQEVLPVIPPAVHIELKKDEHLMEELGKITENVEKLYEEFQNIEAQVKEESKNETHETARETKNRLHNRYVDMVPYDGKAITLQNPSGDPPTTYINASMIHFKDMKQTFIATQAPKPKSFENFWRLVVEAEVKVIVMLTALDEREKKKADQYWPDEKNKTQRISDSITLEHQSTSYQGTYYHRSLNIEQPSQSKPIKVSQLQTIKWADLTAPDDTKILRDLVNKARDLNTTKDPILVHCSAGVGRTGTFIAVYKLINDFLNNKVSVLDVHDTVLDMRRCRMKMVQKKEQYAYIFKCLRDEIKSEDGGYYYDL